MSSSAAIKKAKFAQLVFAGRTLKAAAIAAGYKDGPGLNATASKLVNDPLVVEHLAALRKLADDAAVLERGEALRILTEQARGNLDRFLVMGPNRELEFDFLGAAAEGKLSLLQEVQIQEAGGESPRRVRIKLHDPQAAIDRIARLSGWNAPEKVELSRAPSELTRDERQARIAELIGKAAGALPAGAGGAGAAPGRGAARRKGSAARRAARKNAKAVRVHRGDKHDEVR